MRVYVCLRSVLGWLVYSKLVDFGCCVSLCLLIICFCCLACVGVSVFGVVGVLCIRLCSHFRCFNYLVVVIVVAMRVCLGLCLCCCYWIVGVFVVVCVYFCSVNVRVFVFGFMRVLACFVT